MTFCENQRQTRKKRTNPGNLPLAVFLAHDYANLEHEKRVKRRRKKKSVRLQNQWRYHIPHYMKSESAP